MEMDDASDDENEEMDKDASDNDERDGNNGMDVSHDDSSSNSGLSAFLGTIATGIGTAILRFTPWGRIFQGAMKFGKLISKAIKGSSPVGLEDIPLLSLPIR